MMSKVLFIDDDSPTLKIYKERFSEMFDVLLAPTGMKGVNLAVKEKPNVIILDILLGANFNGYDVLKALRLHKELKKIPVIVLTNLESQEKPAKDLGAVECFVKANISINVVGDIIKKYL